MQTEQRLCQELAGTQGKVGHRQCVAPLEITYSYLWFHSLEVENHHFHCYYTSTSPQLKTRGCRLETANYL